MLSEVPMCFCLLNANDHELAANDSEIKTPLLLDSVEKEIYCQLRLGQIPADVQPEGRGEGAVSRGGMCRMAGEEVPPRRGIPVRSKQLERAFKIL